MKITEGYMPFKEGQTYYRITGECKGDKNRWSCSTVVPDRPTITLRSWMKWQNAMTGP